MSTLAKNLISKSEKFKQDSKKLNLPQDFKVLTDLQAKFFKSVSATINMYMRNSENPKEMLKSAEEILKSSKEPELAIIVHEILTAISNYI